MPTPRNPPRASGLLGGSHSRIQDPERRPEIYFKHTNTVGPSKRMQSVETVVAVGAPSGLFFPPVTVLVCIK